MTTSSTKENVTLRFIVTGNAVSQVSVTVLAIYRRKSYYIVLDKQRHFSLFSVFFVILVPLFLDSERHVTQSRSKNNRIAQRTAYDVTVTVYVNSFDILRTSENESAHLHSEWEETFTYLHRLLLLMPLASLPPPKKPI